MIAVEVEALAYVIYGAVYNPDANEQGRVVPFAEAPQDVRDRCRRAARDVETYLMQHRTYAPYEQAASLPSRADVEAMAPETRGRVEAVKALIRHVDAAEHPGGAMAATLAMLGIDISDIAEQVGGGQRER